MPADTRPTGSSSEPPPPSPLTWSEARSRLHDVLRQYASLSSREHAQAAAAKRSEERQKAARGNTTSGHDGADQAFQNDEEAEAHEQRDEPNPYGLGVRRTRLQRIELWIDRVWLAHELDMVMALLLSAGLLVLSIVSYQQRMLSPNASSSGLNPRADLSVYKSQLAASILFVTGSTFSILVSWRRKVTSRRDSYVGKRRTVLSFLNKLNMWEEAQEEDAVERPTQVNDQGRKKEAVQLSGTALTDVYSVYRLSSDSESVPGGQWHKLPSLLLVQGDFVSLQVGDIAPASCTLVPMADSRSTRGGAAAVGPLHLAAGERFTGTAVTFSTIPPGRSTLKPENSRELLELCNRTSIFVVTETPLINTLSKGHGESKCISFFFVSYGFCNVSDS